jgi:hypothetical protein
MVDEAFWNYREIADFYDRVRIALGAVSDQTIPDAYIDFPERAPFAEARIKSRVPKWAELDEQKFAIFESAIVFQTASMLQSIVANKRVRKKSIPTVSLQYNDTVSFDTDSMSLSDMVELLISELNDEETGSSFFGFRVTNTSNAGCKHGR